MRRMMAGQAERQRDGERRRITREDYERAAAELREAVAEGRISEEDAIARLTAMRRMMAEQDERRPDTDERPSRAPDEPEEF